MTELGRTIRCSVVGLMRDVITTRYVRMDALTAAFSIFLSRRPFHTCCLVLDRPQCSWQPCLSATVLSNCDVAESPLQLG